MHFYIRKISEHLKLFFILFSQIKIGRFSINHKFMPKTEFVKFIIQTQFLGLYVILYLKNDYSTLLISISFYK